MLQEVCLHDTSAPALSAHKGIASYIKKGGGLALLNSYYTCDKGLLNQCVAGFQSGSRRYVIAGCLLHLETEPTYNLLINKPSQDMQLTDKEIMLSLASIRRGQGRKGTGSAKHKPLFLLFLLGRYWNNSSRLIRFRDYRYPFEAFLREFSSKDIHHEAAMYPVWHMQSSEEIFTLKGEETIDKWVQRNGEKDRPNIKNAMYRPFYFGFSPYVYNRIANDKVMLLRLVFELLNNYFTNKPDESDLHLRILQAIGIPIVTLHDSLQKNIFKAYRFSCSVCGYKETETETELTYNLHVANIKTVQAPRDINNSIVMCEQHRALFDFGAFTIDRDKKILVADTYKHEDSSKDLLVYENSKPRLPGSPLKRPSEEYLLWHRAKIYNLQGSKSL